MAEASKVAEFLKIFVPSDGITELRAFGDHNYSGFYDGDHLQEMAEAAIELEKRCRGIYFVPNPVSKSVLSRGVNKIGPAVNCTSDADITERRWLLIDIDPVRPSDTSSTDAEREEAWTVLCHVQAVLETNGFKSPVIACSGNGWHITYPISMPNDSESRDCVKQLLGKLDKICSTAGAKVDIKTYNASRIWKLYGTTARKGQHTEERPHRVAWVTNKEEASSDESVRCDNTNSLYGLLRFWKKQDEVLKSIEVQRDMPDTVKRAVDYLKKMSPAIAGQGGHNRTYHAAMICVEGFNLTQAQAVEALHEWNSKCVPPWSESELAHKVRDADRNAVNRGYLLSQQGKNQIREQWVSPDSLPDPKMSPDDKDATAADLIAHAATVQWTWPGWIQKGTLTALASDPGIGKTRMCADLARRIWHGLPWPDGTPNELPKESRVLWVASDSQWSELGTLPGEFGFPPEAIVLNGMTSNPYAGTNLDSLDDLSAFMHRIQRVQPALVFVDTCGNCTDRNTTRPEDAKQFFKPLAEIATKTKCSIVMVTHLNKNGEALGRRIVGQCRQVIKLECPDPEGSPNRRKLWVDKSNSKKPEALGVTMGDSGNEYDLDPPSSPESSAPSRASGRPSHLAEDGAWLLTYLASGPKRVGHAVREAEAAGITIQRLYRAQKSEGVIQYEVDGRKFWRVDLEEPADGGAQQDIFADNTD